MGLISEKRIAGSVSQVTNPWTMLGSVNVDNVVNTTGSMAILGVGDIGPIEIDSSTHTITCIGYPMHEIHDGNHFAVRGFTTLASGATKVFGVTTPNGSKWAHMAFQIEGNTQTEVRMWEGATLSGGTAAAIYNSNRNATIASILTITEDPTVSGVSPTSGTLIEANSKGKEGANPTQADIGGAITREDEWILKSGTTYMWEIKSAGASNVVDYNGYWYEHTSKTQQF